MAGASWPAITPESSNRRIAGNDCSASLTASITSSFDNPCSVAGLPPTDGASKACLTCMERSAPMVASSWNAWLAFA